MPHFLPLVPNESHKEHQASIFQLPHHAGCNVVLLMRLRSAFVFAPMPCVCNFCWGGGTFFLKVSSVSLQFSRLKHVGHFWPLASTKLNEVFGLPARHQLTAGAAPCGFEQYQLALRAGARWTCSRSELRLLFHNLGTSFCHRRHPSCIRTYF